MDATEKLSTPYRSVWTVDYLSLAAAGAQRLSPMDSTPASRYARFMPRLPWPYRRSRAFVLLTAFAVVAGLGIAFWLLFSVVRPAPPRTVTMVTGAPGGAYAWFAERYRAALAREGIELVLRPSSGSVENLRLLKTDPEVALGFIQSGIANEPESEDLALVASMYVEPVWLFHRLPERVDRLSRLEGRRVAVGGSGSGTQLLALQLLSLSGFAVDAEGLLPLDAGSAADALLAGMIDAAFVVAAPEAPAVAKLLASPDVRLADLAHADAYARRLPHLAPLRLPAGTLDLVTPNPAQDVRLLGTTANLVARADLHPAIVSLLLRTARETHGAPGLFQQAGEYPALRTRELPPHPAAQRFFDSGPPFLQRYLPFWLAILVDRLLVALIPVIAVLIPLVRVTPMVYAWRMRSRIYRWYGELKFLEHELHSPLQPGELADCLARLDRIEEQANRRRIPLAFSNELYTLREHIQLVRRRLLDRAEQQATG